jgi:PAS domain S-box-containing protein
MVSSVKDYAIFMLDPVGNVVSWNEGAQRIKGYTQDEIIGKHISVFYPKEDVEAGKVEMELNIAAKKGRFEDEGWRVRKDGSRVWANVIITSLFDDGGKLRGFSKVTRDITERKQAEEALKKTLKDLERSNKELEQFAYVASHDLQEPLRMISSFTQLLAKRYQDKIDKDANDFINYTVDAANRLQKMIQDLLSYSRISTRGNPLVETDANSALGEAISNLNASIQETGVLIVNDELPSVLADHSQLVQLFQNLLGNAIKFHGEESPRIHISAQKADKEWIFSVKDNGIGIDSQYFERIFVIFQRLHPGSQYPGTGIGLALCNRIVKRHGGRIWVESTPGKGSTFYFTLKNPKI